MSRKPNSQWNGRKGAGAREQLRRDLVERGVDPLFADAVLAEVEIGTTARSGEAILDGVLVAYRVHCGSQDELGAAARELGEVTRLLEDFAIELTKLEESLKTLSAFLTRIKTCVGVKEPTRLH